MIGALLTLAFGLGLIATARDAVEAAVQDLNGVALGNDCVVRAGYRFDF